jgi:PadR family transcriptional regulator, regulatory protein PadR
MLYMHRFLRYAYCVNNKSNFINGIPEMTLLRMLLRDEMYGYELIAAIKQRSNDAFNFGEGCVYPILHRLTAQGYLTTRREVVEGRPRHYYRTSLRGKKQFERLRQEWTHVMRGTQAILEETYA